MLLALLSLPAAQAAEAPAPSQVAETKNEMAYFLSSSIPEKELAILIRGAEARQIPVYFRGLVNDSMEQTARYMMHLVTTYHVKGVQVDPVRFERYGVKQVPALVRKCGSQSDILYGNLSFKDALHIMDTQGDCAKQQDNGRDRH